MTATLTKTTHSMGLKKHVRHRVPTDGTWFRTEANLGGLLMSAARNQGYAFWDRYKSPDVADSTWVPIWVRMELYEAQHTKKRPDGMVYGAVVRIGNIQSPEIEMHGSNYAAGLSKDATLDGWDNDEMWHYIPSGYAPSDTPPGEETSFYECLACKQSLYRDNLGDRSHNSACLFGGTLVCRDCEVTGLVADGETKDQMSRARKLANHIGPECLKRLERDFDLLNQGFSWGHPAQARLFREDKFSFCWSTTIFEEDGAKRRGMNGGLIKHGPHVTEDGNGGYTFRTWDYSANAERDATPEEVAGIHWSIHT